MRKRNARCWNVSVLGKVHVTDSRIHSQVERVLSRAAPPQQIQFRRVRALWRVAGSWLSRDRDEKQAKRDQCLLACLLTGTVIHKRIRRRYRRKRLIDNSPSGGRGSGCRVGDTSKVTQG
jgi:hypothetical protein